MDASPYYYAYTRGLPSSAEHAEVGFVTPLCILLSGSEELVCLFSGTVLLQKRNMKRNRRTEIASGGRYEE